MLPIVCSLAAVGTVAVLVAPSSPAMRAPQAPRLLDLRVGNGGSPFAGDRRLLTTISPNGDGLRERAIVSFRLARSATVEAEAVRTETFKRHPRFERVVWSHTERLGVGRHRITWRPAAATELRTFILRLTVTRGTARRVYGTYAPLEHSRVDAPVVRLLGINVSFDERSYAPGNAARVRIATDERTLSLQVLGYRGDARGGKIDAATGATPVGPTAALDWRGHRNGPRLVRVQGAADLPTGLYFLRAVAPDGRVGYAPFVVRPRAGANRVAVVLSTNTWQAYNFEDANGDGWGDSWYVSEGIMSVPLARHFLGNGVPRRFAELDLPFQQWVVRTGRHVDVLAEDDLERLSGDELAARYDLLVFPGHEEYVTPHVYAAVARFRDLGGNLAFLSADNFFRRVMRRGGRIFRGPPWRNLGRPEARLVGVEYLNSDHCERQDSYLVTGERAAPWFFSGTGLRDGDRFGRYGCEIDARTSVSPPGTIALATIPDLFARGHSAEMSYYETPSGAKVFAAGALNFVASVGSQPAAQLLDNLWTRLSRP